MISQDKREKVIQHLAENRRKKTLLLALEGAVVGVGAGLVAVVYRMASIWSNNLHAFMLSQARTWWLVALFFMLLCIMAKVVSKLITWEPWIAGSGIAEVAGEVRGYFDMTWWRVIIAKLSGSVIGIIAGLSLGREGPSVQLGAMTGKGISRRLKQDRIDERLLMTCGASAGISAAFNCPMSGVMFALETFHKDYSLIVLFPAMTAAVVADFVSKSFFGMAPVFHVPVKGTLPLSDVWLVLLLGVFCGLTGVIFTKALNVSATLYGKMKKLKREDQVIIPFLMAGVLGFFLPQVLGDGHTMLASLSAGKLTVNLIALLLVVKFLYAMICFSSGAPGGSLAPMLVLGAFVGGLYGHLALHITGHSMMYLNNFIILAMAGYFAAIVRAPLTAVLLACELTGSFSHLIYIGLVVVIAESTAALIKTTPLYDGTLQKLMKQHHVMENPENSMQHKTLVGMTVSPGSPLEGKNIASVTWPTDSLLVAIERGSGDIIPHGDTVLRDGDHITLLCDARDIRRVRQEMRDLTSA